MSKHTLCDRFSEYFSSKIANIRSDLLQEDVPHINSDEYEVPLPDNLAMECFEPTTVSEMRAIIKGMKNKTCDLDPAPTSIVKSCLEQLTPYIVDVINASFKEGCVPTDLKQALVCPVLKKSGLDNETLKNFRPVSNLPFLSKVLEKVVFNRLLFHQNKHGLKDVFQSAYVSAHSTETALVRVHNDICRSVDSAGAAILILLDLSAAFDTIDHSILLKRLQGFYGVKGSAIQWITSYLSDRTQSIKLGDVTSSKSNLSFGVPQGSVLGPLLFTMYTAPLGRILKKLGMMYHIYADDTQIYMAFKPCQTEDELTVRNRLETCLRTVKSWMSVNLLKLNQEKTEVMVVSTRGNLQRHNLRSLSFVDTQLEVNSKVKDLGVVFDAVFSMEKHIKEVCKSTYYHLFNIARVRKCLDQKTAETLVHSLITSKLDYCNSVLSGVSDKHLRRLQMVQNSAARIVTMSRKRDHITPVLERLHWLPVKFRIQYKILLFTYKILNGMAPSYLEELLVWYQPSRSLRSCQQHLLHVPRTKLKGFGDRAFSVNAPRLWNALPLHIRASTSLNGFKRDLKTYLFELSYIYGS
jgi:hypothetical protein